ncbi:hypothetical protein CDL12_00946 [Handroanthus impetiginosus]|uniref:Uncharacterized protein n=1 Tax=Handroanthus impetiginosus TaxID=429701 RepID=A0A2G9I969_9LAMI|nr:hypothetical protein CDL12_00946 [Handroanthus impetiginosus]
MYSINLHYSEPKSMENSRNFTNTIHNQMRQTGFFLIKLIFLLKFSLVIKLILIKPNCNHSEAPLSHYIVNAHYYIYPWENGKFSHPTIGFF